MPSSCMNINEIFREVSQPDMNDDILASNNFGNVNFNQTLNGIAHEDIISTSVETTNLRNDINNIINANPNENPSDVNTPHTQQVGRAARLLGQMALDPDKVNQGLAARQARLQERQEAMAEANPVNYSGFQAFFLNSATWLKRRLANAQAPLEKFFLKYAPAEGNTSGANPRIAHLNDYEAKLTAFYKDAHNKYLTPILKLSNDLAKNTGLPPDEVKNLLGKAAMYVSIPERSNYLVKKLYQDYKEYEAKHAGNQDEAILQELAIKRQAYEEMLSAVNDPVPYYANGTRMKTAGWSIPEARELFADTAQKLNLSEEQLLQHTQLFRDAYKYLQNDVRAKLGLIGTDLTNNADLQQMNYFFPIRTQSDIIKGFLSEQMSEVFNPGSLHAMEGISNPQLIMDAYSILEHYITRAGKELAQEDMALDLYAIAQRYESEETPPVKAIDYDDLARLTQFGDVIQRKYAGDMLQGKYGGAPIAHVTTVDGKGNIIPKRYVIYFNEHWSDPQLKLDGKALNQNLVYRDNITTGFRATVGKLTSKYSTLFTKYTPLFAPINYLKDAGERFLNMGNQSYRLENGQLISGSKFRLSYIGNQASVAETLSQYMRGTLDPNSKRGQLVEEYVSTGLKQEFTLGQDYKNELDLAKALQKENISRSEEIARSIWNNPSLKGLKQTLSTLNQQTVGKVLQFIESYNDYLNNIAPLTQYITLREAGVSIESARSGVRELMDLRSRGTWTSGLRCLYPFVPPTVQGGMAMLKGLGLAPNAQGLFAPTKTGAFTFLGLISAYSVLQSFLKGALGTDEDGNDILDSIPVTDLARYIPIPLKDGNLLKLPLPFGASQLATTLITDVDRFTRGRITGADLTFDVVASFLRNVSPLDMPTYLDRENPLKGLVAMFSPMLARGIISTGMNINNFGRTLTFEQESTGLIPLSEQGRASTSLAYHQLARFLQQKFGLDLSPEQWQNITESYLGGPLKIITEYFKQDNIRAAGIDKSTQEILGPTLTALGAAMVFKHTGDLNRWNFFEQKELVESRIRKLGLRPPSGLREEKRLTWYRQQLTEHDVDEDTVQKVILFDAADRQLKQLSREINQQIKTNGAILDFSDRDTLKEIFERWALAREKIYNDTLNQVGR